MQTCFETGNNKLYIQIKNKIIHCPRIHYRYPDIRKIGIGCCGFRSTCIEYDINKMFSKIDQSLENKVKKKTKTNKTNKQIELATTNEKLCEKCRIVRKKDGAAD